MRIRAWLFPVLAMLMAASCDQQEPQPATDATGVPQQDTVRIFFSNRKLDPQALDCAAVYPVCRAVSRATPATALDALLRGPTAAEQRQGLDTSLPEAAKVSAVRMEGQTVRVDFEALPVAGSCMVTAARAQIESTLVTLPGIEHVVISVRGSVAQALQP